jgi:hypothetical protein
MPTDAFRTLAAEAGTAMRGNRPVNFAKNVDFHGTSWDLLHAANLRHGTHGFTSRPKEGVLEDFSALKNPTASAGFEPTNLGTRGQHARPPKPLWFVDNHLLTKDSSHFLKIQNSIFKSNIFS